MDNPIAAKYSYFYTVVSFLNSEGLSCDLHARGRNPSIISLMISKICKNVTSSIRDIVSQVRCKRRNGKISNIRISITLCTIVEDELALKSGASSVSRIRVIISERIDTHIICVNSIIPPLI